MLVLQWRNSELMHAMDGKLVGQQRPNEGDKLLAHERAHCFIPSSSSFHTAHVPTWPYYQSKPWWERAGLDRAIRVVTKLLVLYSKWWID
jgi:hypothetical protein